MAGPKQKFFGSLSLDEIGKAVKGVPSKFVDDPKYGKQLKIQAAQWDDDGISISLYNNETKETFKLGNLRVSQFDKATPSTNPPEAAAADLPF